ncbi:MAG: pyruvate formate lyase family protein [Candidatus Lokiarchaeota archaeon]
MITETSDQSNITEKTLKKYNLDDFPGLNEFREFTVRGPIEFCIERAKLMTGFLKEKGGLDYTDPFTRQADILEHILKNKKPNIFPNDLIAGSSTSKRKGVLFYPEFMGLNIWPELLSLPLREKNPYIITTNEIFKLNEEILPFWMDKSVPELVRKKMGEDDIAYKLHEKLLFYMISKYNCQSHTIPNYEFVLEQGLEGLITKARQKLEKIKGRERNFYENLIKVLKAVIIYSDNLSKEAVAQAKESNDENRKMELVEIAEVCRRVPAKPATSFREAIQSIWTCMNALYQEQNNVGFSIGRIDQLLNEYYLNDLKKGKIKRKSAIELLSHFWLKVGDNIPMVPESGESLFGATGSNQAITIGGCTKEGETAVNETTFLCLDVIEMLKVRDPNLNARVRPNDPPEYTRRLAEVIINTGSTPSLINDDIVIPTLMKTGISERDSRDYAQVGCLEPNSPGRQFGHTGAILINIMSALELALHNGDTSRSKNVGLKTGNLNTYKDYVSFEKSVKLQLEYIIENAVKLNNKCGEIYKYAHPQPLLSSLFEGPLDKGQSLLYGGAKYNSSGIAFIALADLIDSLYTIKKLIFEDRKLTFSELMEVLTANFEDNKDLYTFIINKLDHFGNDVEQVDEIGIELINFLYKVCRSKENYRGGFYNPGYWSMTIHSGFGKISGAYPHGKMREEPLTSGLTPFSKTQKNGLTAVFNSLARVNDYNMPNGMALNIKINKSLFDVSEKINLFIDLFKGYFEEGGMQVQFTIQNAETLIEAKEHPEQYPDLMVRISGYTAYFNDLNEHMKDEIINRALMKI